MGSGLGVGEESEAVYVELGREDSPGAMDQSNGMETSTRNPH